MADRETAFVLPAEAAGGSSTPVHYAGFPGVWYPGRPVAVGALGFATVGEARSAREGLAPDLKETRVEAGSAGLPDRPNHVAAAPTPVAAEDGVPETPPPPPEPPVEDKG